MYVNGAHARTLTNLAGYEKNRSRRAEMHLYFTQIVLLMDIPAFPER